VPHQDPIWTRCVYASHPRTILAAFPRSLCLCDLRASSGHGSEAWRFAIDTKWLEVGGLSPRGVAAGPTRLCGLAADTRPDGRPYHFAVSTSSHVMLLDQRYSKTPLLSFAHHVSSAQNLREDGRFEKTELRDTCRTGPRELQFVRLHSSLRKGGGTHAILSTSTQSGVPTQLFQYTIPMQCSRDAPVSLEEKITRAKDSLDSGNALSIRVGGSATFKGGEDSMWKLEGASHPVVHGVVQALGFDAEVRHHFFDETLPEGHHQRTLGACLVPLSSQGSSASSPNEPSSSPTYSSPDAFCPAAGFRFALVQLSHWGNMLAQVFSHSAVPLQIHRSRADASETPSARAQGEAGPPNSRPLKPISREALTPKLTAAALERSARWQRKLLRPHTHMDLTDLLKIAVTACDTEGVPGPVGGAPEIAALLNAHKDSFLRFLQVPRSLNEVCAWVSPRIQELPITRLNSNGSNASTAATFSFPTLAQCVAVALRGFVQYHQDPADRDPFENLIDCSHLPRLGLVPEYKVYCHNALLGQHRHHESNPPPPYCSGCHSTSVSLAANQPDEIAPPVQTWCPCRSQLCEYLDTLLFSASGQVLQLEYPSECSANIPDPESQTGIDLSQDLAFLLGSTDAEALRFEVEPARAQESHSSEAEATVVRLAERWKERLAESGSI
jgi:hypothetical protein